ncbi:MAG: homoserine kinase [Sphingomonadales bacterium]
MAVYTEVNGDQLTAFLTQYDVGTPRTFKGIAEGVENSNYLLRTRSGSFILTLYEKRVEAADLPYFLDLMNHLAARGVRCPVPIRSRAGATALELCGRPAAIVTFLDGVPVHAPGSTHCAGLGKAAATLHRAGGDFPGKRPNDLSVSGWRPLFEACANEADKVEPGLASLLSEELDYLEQNWPGGLPQGVIHADLFPDNVFFLDDRLSGIIDFYFACNDALAYELAVCLNAWCFRPDGSFDAANAQALMAGYQEVRPLLRGEKQALVTLARGAALRFLLTRLYDWLNQVDGALVKCKDPREYIPRLAFHRKVAGPAEYGL